MYELSRRVAHPPHNNFNDAQILAKLLGVHLGVDDTLPGGGEGQEGIQAGRLRDH